jgi:ADP-ribosylglycohydrolase
MNTKSRIAGAFIGLAVGDAMGAPLERKEFGTFPFETEMGGGGPYELPPGAWTDETATSLCLAQSLLVTHELNVYDLVERLKKWVETGENTSTGSCIGVEQKLLNFLANFDRGRTINSNHIFQKAKGSSVLARVAPIACIHWDDLQSACRIAKQQSYLTHSSEIVASSCEFLVLVLSHMIAGREWGFILNMPIDNDWPEEIKAIAGGVWTEKERKDLKSTKNVIDILGSACWLVNNSESFEEAVTAAVNLGGNSDTLGAVVGQIAGALYGLESIPVRWFDQLAKVEHLTDVAMQMVELSRSD